MTGTSPVLDDVAANIMNERRGGPIDRNPSMDCEECGTSYNWKNYWQHRIDSPEDEFICDSCQAEKIRQKRRELNNQSLTEWSK